MSTVHNLKYHDHVETDTDLGLAHANDGLHTCKSIQTARGVDNCDNQLNTQKIARLVRTASQVEIDVGDYDLSHQVEQAWAALKTANRQHPSVFNHYGSLVRVTVDHTGPKINTLEAASFRLQLDQVAQWFRWEKRGEKLKKVNAYPPTAVVSCMLAESDPPVPMLKRVVSAPVFAADGTLLTEPGYHPAAEVWYHPTCDIPPVSERPTHQEVKQSISVLADDMLGGFPFEDESSKANAIAPVLVPTVRYLITGPTPLHIIDAVSGPGTGKSLYAQVVASVADANPIAVMTAARSEEEWRKRITAKLVGNPTHILIDNVGVELDSDALASVTTTPFWEDRLLGESRIVRMPVECCWMATGNSVETSGDLARRLVKIRLDAKMEQPWRRSNFKHPHLLDWCSQNRGYLIHAVLTLVRAWVVAGCPEGEQVLGSYESYSRVIGGILKVAGIPGFLGNLNDENGGAGEKTRAFREFVTVWWNEHKAESVSTAQLYALVVKHDLLWSILGSGSDQTRKIKLGRLLSSYVGRQFSDYKVTNGQDDKHVKVRGYCLVEVEK